MVISPINGSLSFSNIWETNQYAESGQTIVTIVPHQQNTIIGKVIIPIKRAGKIKVGQSINLKFDNYPSQEFGMLTTTLEGISLVPDSAYVGSISLPDTLITNYGLIIPFGQNLQGEAELITENMSLMTRLINPLKELLKRQHN
jgi:HlyD family secretion protein